MGAAYSVDLRRKVVEACERGTASQAEVAQFFGVSVSFAEKLLRLYRRTGAFEPDRRRAGRPAQIDAAACAQVQRWLEEQNDLTLAELAEQMNNAGRYITEFFFQAACAAFMRRRSSLTV